MFSMTLIDAFFNFFKFLCILATAFMVGFWLVKFKQDHDVTLIEYKAIEDFDELIHPVTTLCFYKSFYMNKSLNALEYIDYLEGKRKDVNRYHDIDYDKVSVNLHEHFRNITIRWKPSKTPSDFPCKDVNDCQYYNLKNNYNGFSNEGHFIKCFGIEVNKTYAKDVSSMSVFFNKNLKNAIGTSWMVQAFFNYPNQFTRPRGGPITIWQKKENNGSHYNNWEFIQITSIELLKRRNKRDKKCTTQWSRFDDLLLERHVKSVGCRAPYISDFAEFPMCNTQVGMKKSSYWGLSLQKAYNLEDPCQEMPNIDFKHAAIRTYNLNVFGVQIGFPLKGKIITQLQEVDAHSLIGNIGGYIGLFLGYAIIQLPEYLLSLFNYLKKKGKHHSIRGNKAGNSVTTTQYNKTELSFGNTTNSTAIGNHNDALNLLERMNSLEKAVKNMERKLEQNNY